MCADVCSCACVYVVLCAVQAADESTEIALAEASDRLVSLSTDLQQAHLNVARHEVRLALRRGHGRGCAVPLTSSDRWIPQAIGVSLKDQLAAANASAAASKEEVASEQAVSQRLREDLQAARRVTQETYEKFTAAASQAVREQAEAQDTIRLLRLGMQEYVLCVCVCVR